MNTKDTVAINGILKDLSIHFVGDPGRGWQLQEAATKRGWELRIETRQSPASDERACPPPDLVILDDFPESPAARSAYYWYTQYHRVVFLALNASPDAMKFLHVNALTRLRIIDLFPDPKALIYAIIDLVRAGRKSLTRHAGTIEIEKQSPGHHRMNLDATEG